MNHLFAPFGTALTFAAENAKRSHGEGLHLAEDAFGDLLTFALNNYHHSEILVDGTNVAVAKFVP